MDINLKQRDRRAARRPGPAIDATAPYLNGPNTFAADARARRTPTTRGGRWTTGPTWARRRSRPTCRSRAPSWARRSTRRTSAGSRSPAISARSPTRRPPTSASTISSTASSPRPTSSPTSSPTCVPGRARGQQTIAALDENGEPFKALVKKLVDKQVALTSTLTVFETFTPGRPMPPGLDVLLPQLQASSSSRRYAAHAQNHAVDLHDALSEGAGARARVRARRRPARRRHRSDRRRRRDSRATRTSGSSSCSSRRASRRSRRSRSAR